MVENPTPGFLYFMESEDDDWITDHAGDPDVADLDLMTEGTSFCKLEVPEKWKKRLYTGIITTPTGGGKSFSLRDEGRWYQILSRGIETSRANADLVEKFFSLPRHTSGASATYVDYYLVIYLGLNDHVQFTDSSGNRKSYCPVDCAWVDCAWSESANPNVNVAIQINSVW